MELKNFREKGKTNYVFVWIGFSLVILLTIIIFIRSYALYEEKKTYDVIQGNVPHFLDSYDVQVAFTLDGVASSSKPQGEDLVVDQIVCTNGALGFWDSEKERFYLESLTKSKTKCRIDFVTRYEEAILVGNDPKLSSILVPIQIMEDGVVKKASLGDEWYRYENKNWANAVILKDKQVVYSSGETIPEENIESYFVWIPKYEYQIFNDGNYQSVGTVKEDHSQEIQVRFQKQDEVTNGSQSVGEWFSHPAFKNSGFWVGKFETGYRDATNSNEAVQDEIIPKQIVIKPNVYSWRGVRVSTAFQNAYQYQREYDSHMMKNTEWGAVAYLSHSKYGIMNSIRYNNHSDYKTGYAAVLEPTCDINDETCNQTGNTENVTKPYNTNIGYLASTTGNISGIYDMSGGAHEFVMGVLLDEEGNPYSGRNYEFNSGFNGKYGIIEGGHESLQNGISFPNEMYYDRYSYSTDNQSFHYRLLGDATGEMGPFYKNTMNGKEYTNSSWYQNDAYFIQSTVPWFIRGGTAYHGTGAGIFSFSQTTGGKGDYTYRIVLSF